MQIQQGSTPSICIPYDAAIILSSHIWRAVKNGVMTSDWGPIDSGQGAPSTYSLMGVTLTAGATDTLGQLWIQYTDDVTNAGQIELEVVAYDPAVGAVPDPADIWDLADAIETGVTPRGALRLLCALMAGPWFKDGAGMEVFQNVGATKDRATYLPFDGISRADPTLDLT